jgi:outer membrane protein
MRTILFMIGLCTVALNGSAQGQKAYGHCDVMEVWDSMPEKARIERELQKMERSYQRDLAGMMEEYEAGVTVDPEKWRTWSNEKRDSATLAWQRMEERIVRYREKMDRQVLEKEEALLKPVRERIRAAIAAVAEANGLLYVFDSSTQEILHAGGGDEVTDDVIARLRTENRKTVRP